MHLTLFTTTVTLSTSLFPPHLKSNIYTLSEPRSWAFMQARNGFNNQPLTICAMKPFFSLNLINQPILQCKKGLNITTMMTWSSLPLLFNQQNTPSPTKVTGKCYLIISNSNYKLNNTTLHLQPTLFYLVKHSTHLFLTPHSNSQTPTPLRYTYFCSSFIQFFFFKVFKIINNILMLFTSFCWPIVFYVYRQGFYVNM